MKKAKKEPKSSNRKPWIRDKKYVLSSLEMLYDAVEKLNGAIDTNLKASHAQAIVHAEELSKLRLDVRELRTKLALWAAIIIAGGSVIAPFINNALSGFIK